MSLEKPIKANILTRVFLDFLSLIYTFFPAILSWMIALNICYLVSIKFNVWPAIFLFPILLCFVFFIITFVFYLSLPKLKAGQYKMKFSKEILTWYLHLALNRSSKILGLRYLINSFFILKFLHLRSLGAKVKFDLGTSLDFVIADLPLIKIGNNCTFGQNFYVSCHLIKNDTLFLLPVTIGDNVNVGMNCVIGPGSRIGDNTSIGIGNYIFGIRLKNGTTLKPGEWMFGPPSLREHYDKK